VRYSGLSVVLNKGGETIVELRIRAEGLEPTYLSYASEAAYKWRLCEIGYCH